MCRGTAVGIALLHREHTQLYFFCDFLAMAVKSLRIQLDQSGQCASYPTITIICHSLAVIFSVTVMNASAQFHFISFPFIKAPDFYFIKQQSNPSSSLPEPSTKTPRQLFLCREQQPAFVMCKSLCKVSFGSKLLTFL